MSCRTSGAGSAPQPGGAAGPVLTVCAGSRFRPLAVGYLRVWPSDPQGHAYALSQVGPTCIGRVVAARIWAATVRGERGELPRTRRIFKRI